MALMRSKTVLGGTALVIVLGFVGALVAFNDPQSPAADEGPTEFPNPSLHERADEIDREDDPELNPTAIPAAQPSIETSSTCTRSGPKGAGARILAFDSLDEVELIDGEADLAIDEDGKGGKGALRVDVGQRTQDAWLRARLDEPLDVSEGSFGVWLRQNGNLIAGDFDWAIRFFSDDTDFFQYSVQPVAYERTRGQWCHQLFELANMQPQGDPDATAITHIELSGPRYYGAGVGNTVWYDELRSFA